jgi:hypothetical protein
MTKKRRRLRKRKGTFTSAMIWISLIFALLFLVILYPKGHSLYANPEKKENTLPVTTVDKHPPAIS